MFAIHTVDQLELALMSPGLKCSQSGRIRLLTYTWREPTHIFCSSFPSIIMNGMEFVTMWCAQYHFQKLALALIYQHIPHRESMGLSEPRQINCKVCIPDLRLVTANVDRNTSHVGLHVWLSYPGRKNGKWEKWVQCIGEYIASICVRRRWRSNY